MRRGKFEEIVARALDGIPDEFQSYLENVVVRVAGEPTPKHLEAVGLPGGEELFGCYIGSPLTERGVGEGGMLPDEVMLFQGPLERWCRTEEELVEEIRRTVVHEVGHHFGLSDEEMPF